MCYFEMSHGRDFLAPVPYATSHLLLVKASTDRERAGNKRASGIILTMRLYAGIQTECSRACILLACCPPPSV